LVSSYYMINFYLKNLNTNLPCCTKKNKQKNKNELHN
jgi:hypothetical protein